MAPAVYNPSKLLICQTTAPPPSPQPPPSPLLSLPCNMKRLCAMPYAAAWAGYAELGPQQVNYQAYIISSEANLFFLYSTSSKMNTCFSMLQVTM